MRSLSCQEIRNKWIEFFTKKCERKHNHIVSASLVPDNPTLLLNAAGMVQFVPIFMGTKPAPEPPRAITIQKCARVGGKDSDLENIGRTTRHHSFFEMLGNFSFGDYFKQEAITWAWQFVTEELELDPQRLYVSVFKGDEQNYPDNEAKEIWMKVLEKNFPTIESRSNRIWQMGRKDNFWGPPGATGPCGPCSEIYYDHKPGTPMPELSSEDFDNRFTEIWNLVFMEFNKDEEANFSPLANKNIDTGAGLERIATIVQGVHNSFETDELFSVMQELGKLITEDTGEKTEYQLKLQSNQDAKSYETNLYLKIITDHLRCAVFLIADGVRPSNLGRGYVLRMIIRRAARFLYLLRNKADTFLYKAIDKLVEKYSLAYPELKTNSTQIKAVLEKEEEQFSNTIINGLKILEATIIANEAKRQTLAGDFVFDLYSTYGFPLELTLDIAKEKGFTVDLEAYESAKEAHSKASGTGAFDKSVESNAFIAELIKSYGKTKFLGYDTLESNAKVLYIDGKKLVLDQTPFYAESGGQLADKGIIYKSPDSKINIVNVKSIEGIFVHELEETGDISVGDEVTAQIDFARRDFTLKHHTSCHLLQAALRKILGNHIQQMGSQVGPEYTRFDFNLDRGMTKEELKQVEDLINSWIKAKLPVTTKVMDYEEAVKAGALSFFEDKYDDEVRVLFIGDSNPASVELCGGTHVKNLEEIDQIIIASEGSVASGIRRIKLLANKLAYNFIQERDELSRKQEEEEALKEKLKQEAKARAKELAEEALKEAKKISQKAQELNNNRILILNINEIFPLGLDPETTKTLAETLINKYSLGFVLLGGEFEAKVVLVAAAKQELVQDKNSIYNAANAVKTAAQICGGGGGGRPNLAQAGGKDPSKIQEALDTVLTQQMSVINA
jgi:alanyl-tRNA synthetase